VLKSDQKYTNRSTAKEAIMAGKRTTRHDPASHLQAASARWGLARRLPNATLRIYPDAGHGGIFQAHERLVPEAFAFLEAWNL
jgi:pimeloyl-ACP methyl ester carboxylesterase